MYSSTLFFSWNCGKSKVTFFFPSTQPIYYIDVEKRCPHKQLSLGSSQNMFMSLEKN